jgi:hypothetical protein
MKPRELISLANSRMSITRVCNMLGVSVGDFTYGSIKTYCPFGQIWHTDGGTSKAFRIYAATNSCYCFAGCGMFTPVTLLAKARDQSPAEVAEWILAETGYVPPDYVSQWEALTSAPTEVDRDALSEALKYACAGMDPAWEDKQFEQPVAATFTACLALLPKVTTASEATTWLAATKTAMRRVLGGPT